MWKLSGQAKLVSDSQYGKILSVNTEWDSGTKIEVKEAEKLFGNQNFTLMMDVKKTKVEEADQEKKAAVSIGNEEKCLEYIVTEKDDNVLYYQLKVESELSKDVYLWQRTTDGRGLPEYVEKGWNSGRMDNYSHSIVVWESDDLVNWSEPWLAEIAIDSAYQTWAPEAIWSEETQDYLVYWSSRDQRDPKGVANQTPNSRVYCAHTRDFRTFSEPEIFVTLSDPEGGTVNDPSFGEVEVSAIDTSIAKCDGIYYRATKNDGTRTLFVDTSETLEGPWTRLGVVDKKNYGIGGQFEEPCMYQLPDKSWIFMGDSGPYRLLHGETLADVTNPEKFPLIGKVNSYTDSPAYGHGTVLPISDTEYQRLIENMGGVPKEKGDFDADKVPEKPIALYAKWNTEETDPKPPIDPEVTLDKITVKAPKKTEYKQGEDLDLTGMEVTAHYSDGKEEVLPEGSYEVSGYDPQKVGEQTITVTYEDQTATFKVTVKEASKPVDPENPGNPDDGNGGDQGQKPDSGAGEDQGQKPGALDKKPAGSEQNSNKVPKTGDAADLTVYALSMMAALAAGGRMLKRRKKENNN